MRFHSITLSAGAALALVLCGTGAVGKPARKPATAAAPAKPAKPSQKFSETFPEAAAGPEAEAAAAAIEGAEPPAATAPPSADQAPPSEAAPPAEASAAPANEPAPPSEAATAPASDAAHPVDAPDPRPSDAPATDVSVSDVPAESEAAAMPKKGEPPTRAFMVGVWAEPGKSCDTALDFKADGTLIGPFPRWELDEAGVLTMVGNRQKIMLKVIDKDTLQSRRSEADPPRTLKRC